ncbi:uncharacterized protein LOC115795883 [Archocentrus centrarchus]|uniref:uncharacterized protein LOC115795883 n=1 Tax=Archocentrus centrarchus TaxID=63155 RepID=UPI0011EA056A|nr:uncharacterized protein LOC115795883 [Archocentrus centrarchus]
MKSKEEEGLDDQEVCNQERNSSLDQEDSEPPQIKEEQEELCTSHEGEQLVLKQETEGIIVWTREDCLKLLDTIWKSEIKPHGIDLPQQIDCKEEEVLTDEQDCNEEKKFSLDQEHPDPPQFKEEQEDLYTSQKGEQLLLKQETETFMVTPTNEQNNHSEPEPERDQLLSHNSSESESQDSPLKTGRKAEWRKMYQKASGQY